MMFEVTLKERGSPNLVPSSAWREAALEEPMSILATRGIVRLTRTAVGVLVTPGHHVGEMVLPSAVVRIQPKSADLLDALMKLALRAKVKKARHFQAESRAALGNEQDPAARFVKALLECVREGFPWRYGVRTSATSFPRGRIQFGRTVRELASRGIKHRVVTTLPTHVQEVDFIRVVRMAIECLPGVPGASRKLLAEVDLLASAMDSSRPFPSIEAALEVAYAFMDRVDQLANPAALELAKTSVELIGRKYAATGLVEHVPGGVARFQDLEDLWEQCSQHLVERWLRVCGVPGSAALHALRASGVRLFEDGGPALDPDIVVNDGPHTIAIFDAKYKALNWGSSGSAADIYQITAYVERLSASIGILVYFAYEREQVRLVGTTSKGAQVACVSISPELLLAEGENALVRLFDDLPSVGKRLKQRLADRSSHEGSNGISNLSRDVLFRPEKDKVIREGL